MQNRISVCARLGVRSGSNHCRRYCAKKRFAHSRLLIENWSSYPKHRFDRRFEPGSQGGTPRAFCVTFCTPQKVTIRLPFGNFLTSRKFAPVGVARCACYGASRHFPERRNATPPVHAKRVQIGGGAPTPRILSCFFKSR